MKKQARLAVASLAMLGYAPWQISWADNEAPALDEIVVTAQKREENLTQVPISITVVSPETLNSTSSKNLAELQGVVPGVTFEGDRSYGGATVAMRGTSGSTVPLQDDPVAIYVDGVYVPPNYFGVGGLADISSMEIVRGPQGTLQGRNATAGAILVRTADPESTFGGYAQASGAAPAQYRVQGAVTGPLIDNLSARLSIDQYEERGWAENFYNGDHLGGVDSTNIRATLLWKSDAFKARLAVDYLSYTAHEALASWAQHIISPTGQAIPIATPGLGLSPSDERSLEDGHFYQDIPTGYTMESPSLALELDYDFGPAELVSVSGANRYATEGETDSSGIALLPRAGYNVGLLGGNFLSEELRLQSAGSGPLQWLVGGYASKADGVFDFNIYNLMFTAPNNSVAIFNAHQVNPSFAGFTDVAYRFAPKFALTGGVRYTEESKTFRNEFLDNPVPGGAALLGPLNFNPPKATWDDTSYRAKLDFNPTENSLIYASYSKGFKSGGFNAFTVGTSQPFNPEILKSGEVGAKADLWDNRVHVAGSAYYNNYDNLQVTVGVPTGGVVIDNAASAKIKGFEFESKGRITENLSIEGNVAYTDGKYTRFDGAQDIYGNFVDASGNRLTVTPLWQYFVQASYEWSAVGSWTGLGQLNWRWRDKVYYTATNQDLANFQGEQDGELGTRLKFEDSNSKLWLALYGANLTDRRVVNSLALAFNYPLVSFNRPRTVGGEIGWKF